MRRRAVADSKRKRNPLRYWPSRLLWSIRSGEPACTVRSCPAPRVGFSSWCRVHTDQIITRRHDPGLGHALSELGYHVTGEAE